MQSSILDNHLMFPQVALFDIMDFVGANGISVLTGKGKEIFFVALLPLSLQRIAFEVVGICATEIGF